MCQFSVENDSSYISGDGNCLAVTYKPQQQLIARSCNERYQPLCYRPSQTTKFFTLLNTFDWLHALSGCYVNNSQFASTSISFKGLENGTYWVGGFAVTYKNTNDRCIAVSRADDRLSPVVLSCDTLLPALYVNTSVPTQTTTELNIQDTTSITTTDGVRPNQQITNNIIQDNNSSKQQTTRRGHEVTTHIGLLTAFQESVNNLELSPSTSPEQLSVPTVVGSVVGGVAMLIIIVVAIFLLRRRGLFKKLPAAENSGDGDDIEMRKPDKVDHSYTEVISTSDNVYNHLGELKTKHNVSGDDLYDHSGDHSETYGQLHTHNNKYEDDSEYDHTFNHTARDTYGHLNSVYPRDDDSDDTYGRLHAGKRRDSDDVYDHTGGSGNTYDHINFSKRPPEVESDYDHTRLSQ
ncbi:uncharacterized protein LOC117329946 [Pecten maximus]|uniref:uncharacterized protein LOC117329946 n=1 Tax=Pecten maximus TaxID=6579 RepID=UPI001458D95A|nr:uncharacterized protein LOC117329946 [Pecten maximus]